ncbi:hypothetical protein AVEN_252686-1 [Araneus ventricosus]|uniref:Uncharacterized protein n=1 Tax=Araneus ventricosus TaxID=182803 RepID=A0A4Y2C3X4_ARAVE|nr:hypothetical protein AVEN_252686-1 [Araneus ventricosus]
MIPFISTSLPEIATLVYLASSEKELSELSEKLVMQICSIVFNFKTKPYDSFLTLGDAAENPEFPNWTVLEFFQKMHSLVQISEFGKNLFNIGSCGLHVMHNAFKAGCIASTWGIVDFLTALYYLFKNSPACRDDFLKESEGALPKKFIQHRWLENVPASESALNLLPSIKKYIVSVDKGEHYQSNCKLYTSVKTHMHDNLLSVKLKVFHSIAKLFLPFLTKYQTDKPMLFFLPEDLKKIVNFLLQRFVLSKNLNTATTLQKLFCLDINNPKIHKPIENIDLGFSAEKEIQSLRVSKIFLTVKFLI